VLTQNELGRDGVILPSSTSSATVSSGREFLSFTIVTLPAATVAQPESHALSARCCGRVSRVRAAGGSYAPSCRCRGRRGSAAGRPARGLHP
jgi:hypothetical protein